MLSNVIVRCFVLLHSLYVVYGYTCYKCSYSADTDSRRFCVEDPVRLGFGGHLKCNSTSYCVLQEQYSLSENKVTSYFRSCSGVSWGNECNRDWSHITCRMSCQGNFCNERENGTRYVQYMESDQWNSAKSQVTSPSWFPQLIFLVTTSWLYLVK